MKQQYESPSVTVILTEPETVMAAASATDMDVPVINTEETHEPEEALSRPWLLTLLLLFLPAITATALTVGDAFYIYRNDGQFNAFFRDEVDSIAYSNYDADSVYCDEVVTQVVYTPDSIYRISLAAIDSVGFVQPAPVYEENTRELSGSILDYILSVDGLTIYMKTDTPEDLVPLVGQNMAQLGFTDLFPDGFVGQVNSVTRDDEQITVECTPLQIDDVVTQFYGIYRLSAKGDAATSRLSVRRSAGQVIYDRTLPGGNIPMKVSLSWLDIWKDQKFLGEALQYGAKGDLSIDIEPSFDIKVTYYRNDLLGIIPRYNAHVVTNFSITEDLELMGTIEGEKKWPVKLPFGLEKLKDFPIAPGVTFYLDAGLKVSGSGSLGVGAMFHQTGQHVLDVNFYPIPRLIGPAPMMPVSTVKHSATMTSHNEDWLYVVGDFETKLGPFLEFGFGFINHKVTKIGAEFDGGVKFKGSIKFNTTDWQTAESSTDFYEGCVEDSKVTVDAFVASYGILAAFDEKLKFSVGDDWNLPNLFHRESSLLPSFSSVKLQHQSGSHSKLMASANVRNNCIIPLQLGFVLFDDDDTNVENHHYEGGKYWTQNSFSSYPVNFESDYTGGNYTAYPTVRLFGKDILASPSAELDIQFPVTITDFKVTKSHHEQGEFYNDGQYYDYRFDAATTVTLDDSEGVADWGYVYRDPNGQEKEISLRQYGTSYTDTHYAYFRNQAHSTACLYGYVKYSGSDETVYGEPHDYPLDYQGGETSCPDANHPHMIDLGLPRGTKWACCNVGANSPEDYGNYYAWGETSTKSVYDWDTYAYYNSNTDEFVSIGSDISGTSYDAATANWGAPWCMPSSVQIRELLTYCSSTWTTQNGVNGRKFVGSNGGAVFIPAAGYHWDLGLDDAGSGGYYWSSTLDESFSDSADALAFGSGGAQWSYYGGGSRLFGHSVRPVR